MYNNIKLQQYTIYNSSCYKFIIIVLYYMRYIKLKIDNKRNIFIYYNVRKKKFLKVFKKNN